MMAPICLFLAMGAADVAAEAAIVRRLRETSRMADPYGFFRPGDLPISDEG